DSSILRSSISPLLMANTSHQEYENLPNPSSLFCDEPQKSHNLCFHWDNGFYRIFWNLNVMATLGTLPGLER
ncbi:MAG: hypothetical protein LBL59_03620, partial [Xanthomonadaceae bacterium]|nr:hypothetical protein [Xanthomonadaceae bacterium]